MTDFEIPADILDAGARAYASDTYRGTRGLDGYPLAWETLTDTDRAACMWKARVVLAAALPLLERLAAAERRIEAVRALHIDEGGLVRCGCGRAVPCRHCPTTPTPISNDTPSPIDPADIRPGSRVGAGHVRPGDVLDITYRVTVTAVGDECDIETDDRQRKHNLHAFNATGHLVHRPDPDAEAVRAIRSASYNIHHAGERMDPLPGLPEAADLLTKLREQGWDVVRRAES